MENGTERNRTHYGNETRTKKGSLGAFLDNYFDSYLFQQVRSAEIYTWSGWTIAASLWTVFPTGTKPGHRHAARHHRSEDPKAHDLR